MFIDENTARLAASVANPYYAEATADPMYLMEAVEEANDAMYELSMKMAKCEHACIVNENMSMLTEAQGDFKDKAKNVVNTILAKFMAFIDRVRAEWSKLWSGMLSKLVDTSKVNEMLKNCGSLKIEADIAGFGGVKSAMSMYSRITSVQVGNIDKVKEEFSKIATSANKDGGTGRKTRVTTEMVKECAEFIRLRPQYIKELEKLKNTAKAAAKLNAVQNDTSVDGLALSKYSSIVSKAIAYVNKATAGAVKVCRAALKAGKNDKTYQQYSADKKASAKADKASQQMSGQRLIDQGKAIKNGKADTSILDMF